MIDLRGQPIRIATPRLLLRPVEEEDVTAEYVSGLNDPAINEYLVSVKLVRQTSQTVKAFVAANSADPQSILFGMFVKPTLRLIGTVRLHGLEQVHGTGTIGVCIFLREFWSRGYSSRGHHRRERLGAAPSARALPGSVLL